MALSNGLVGLLTTLWIVFIGVGQGASISLSFAFLGLRASNARQAAELSGIAQSIGYMLAAIGPFLMGYLFDKTHSWTLPLILLLVTCVLMIIAGLGAGRNIYVLQSQNR